MFKMLSNPILFIWMTLWLAIFSACSSEGPSPSLSPEKELATFHLEEGLQIDLVAAEPLVEDPVVINFDEAGRLWVVEMRGFMPNIDMEGEDEPTGRVSVLLDQDADGKMDTSIVFLDSLVLPRALAFVPGGVLIAEKKPLWLVKDLDGDLVADHKILLDSTYGGQGLPEHSPNGLWRNIDNWYYNAKSVLRYKFGTDEQLITDTTEFRGQWGISHDDAGRLFYNYNWSQLHADLIPPNYFSRNPNHIATTGIDHGLTLDRRVYPVRPNPAVNRGYIPGTLDEEGKLQEFTSACAPLVYRGDLLPKEYYGNAFVCEPAGNLIKRNVVRGNAGVLSAYDPNPGVEFLASTDERFRPVYLANGPDGALYIADMYRGINQHGAYMTPYLKEQTLKRKLESPINKGRIWRISPKGWDYKVSPPLSETSVDFLVNTLLSANGWQRDAAQQLLIAKNEEKSLPLLEDMALQGANELGQLHALWTLEGMNKVPSNLLLQALDDPSPLIQIAALRILEPIAKKDRLVLAEMQKRMTENWSEVPQETALQIALSAAILNKENKLALLSNLASKYAASPLMRDAILSSSEGIESLLYQKLSNTDLWNQPELNRDIFMEMLKAAIIQKDNTGDQVADHATEGQNLDKKGLQAFIKGRTLYLSACASCHGTDGAGLKRFAPPLVNSEWVLGDEKKLALILLHGLEGPIEVNGIPYDAPDILPVMPAHSTLDDAEIAAILTYIRNTWGHQAGPIERSLVGRTRVTSQGRVIPWTAPELLDLPVETTENIQ